MLRKGQLTFEFLIVISVLTSVLLLVFIPIKENMLEIKKELKKRSIKRELQHLAEVGEMIWFYEKGSFVKTRIYEDLDVKVGHGYIEEEEQKVKVKTFAKFCHDFSVKKGIVLVKKEKECVGVN